MDPRRRSLGYGSVRGLGQLVLSVLGHLEPPVVKGCQVAVTCLTSLGGLLAHGGEDPRPRSWWGGWTRRPQPHVILGSGGTRVANVAEGSRPLCHLQQVYVWLSHQIVDSRAQLPG